MDMKMLMRQAQEMQKKMQQAQEEMANQEFTGSSGGGMVQVVITGSGITKKVSLDSSLVKADEKEILEDLLVAAINDAKKKSEESSANSMKSITNGLNLPKGFGF